MMKKRPLFILFPILSILPILLLGQVFWPLSTDEPKGDIGVKSVSVEEGKLKVLLEGEDIEPGIEAFLSPLPPEHAGMVVKTWGKIMDVQVSGGYAFLANANRGVQVVQLAPRSSQEIVATVETPGKAWRLVLKDGYCFVADVAGLLVIDVREPREAKRVASLSTEGDALALHASGDLLLLCDGKKGVKFYDIADPENPRLLSALMTEGVAFDATIVGKTAYVADGTGGIRSIDISNPDAPRIVGRIESSNRPYFVAEGEGLLFSGGMDHLLELYTLPDLSCKRLNLPAKPFSAHVKDQRLYVSHHGGVSIFALDDPKEPVLIETLEVEGTSFACDVFGEAVVVANGSRGLRFLPPQGSSEQERNDLLLKPTSPLSAAYVKEHIFLSSPKGIEGFHWGEGLAPQWSSSVSSPLRGRELSFSGGVLAVSDSQNLIHFLDVEGSSRLSEFAQCRIPGRVEMIRLSGSEAFAVSGNTVYRIDLAQTPPVPQSFLKAPGKIAAFDLREEGISLVTACGRLALVTRDSVSPSSRFFPLNLGKEVVDAVFSDKRIYLVLSEGELVVVDSSRQGEAAVVRRISRAGPFPSQLFLAGGHLAVDNKDITIDIFDLKDPDSPQKVFTTMGQLNGTSSDAFFVSTLDRTLSKLSLEGGVPFRMTDLLRLEETPLSFAVSGDNFCLVDNSGNVSCYDTGNPIRPELKIFEQDVGNVRDMVLGGEICYLAQHEKGIALLDLSDPVTPVLLGEDFVPCDVRKLDFVRDHLFAVDGHGTMRIFEVGSGKNLIPLGVVRTGGGARDVAVKDDTAYVADGEKGLQVVDLTDPSNPQLLDRHLLPWPASRFASLEGVEVFGDYLFIIYNQGIFQVFDIRNSRELLPLSFVDLPGFLVDIEISGRFALLASSEGVVVVDIADPKDPVVVDTIRSVENVKKILAQDDFFFALSPCSGVRRYSLPLPKEEVDVVSKTSLSISFPIKGVGGRYRLSLFDSVKQKIYSDTLDLKSLQTL